MPHRAWFERLDPPRDELAAALDTECGIPVVMVIRRGSSICSRKPASTMARYSSFIASAGRRDGLPPMGNIRAEIHFQIGGKMAVMNASLTSVPASAFLRLSMSAFTSSCRYI
jgi:hypothetical protein